MNVIWSPKIAIWNTADKCWVQGSPANFEKFRKSHISRYCSDTLEDLRIISDDDIVLPPSGKRLMTNMKTIKLFTTFSHEISRNVLSDCKKLVELNMCIYDGPFIFTNHNFPHLQKLEHRVRVYSDNKFEQMKIFLQNHPKLTTLHIQFLRHRSSDYIIDLSFIAYLLDLTELHLIINGAKIISHKIISIWKSKKVENIDHR